TDLFLALDDELDAERQLTAVGQPGAHGGQVGHPAAHVIRRPASVQTLPVRGAQARRLVRRRVPHFTRYRLQIQMPVDQQCGGVWSAAVALRADQGERTRQLSHSRLEAERV